MKKLSLMLVFLCVLIIGVPSFHILGTPVFAQTTDQLVPTVGTNFTASTYKYNVGNPPPDSMGAVGPKHFVEFINSRYAVYEKATGNLVQQSTLDEFWEASWANSQAQLANPYTVGFPSSAAFDPRILYDNASQRWYAIADASMELLVAVSNTSDPTQGWKGYQIDAHADFEFEMTSTDPTVSNDDLINDLNNGRTDRVMQALLGHITFNPNEYLISQAIEPNVRWGVLCRFPLPSGGIGGCHNNSRLIRNENNHLRVYLWNNNGGNIDFPTLGMDADNLYVATQFNGAPFFLIRKEGLRSGTPPALPVPADVSVIQNGLPSGQSQPIVDLDGNTDVRALVVTASYSNLTFQHCDIAGCHTMGSISLTPYNAPGDAAQPGGKRSGAGGHGFITNSLLSGFSNNTLSSSVVLRNGEIHGVQTVNNAGVTRLRYFRAGVEYNALSNTFTFTPLDDILIPNPASSPALNAFYGSIAVNEHGQVVIGFTGSSTDQYASSYAVVGQLGPIPSVHMSFDDPILLKAGHHEYEVGSEDTGPCYRHYSGRLCRNRWGDYSATTVDPFDPFRFWTIQEWASAVDIWSTQVSEIRLTPEPEPVPAPFVSAVAIGSATPSTTLKFNDVIAGDLFGDFNKGLAVPNGHFIIAPNIVLHHPPEAYSAYTANDLPVGDGHNEVTRWSFNFAEDLQSLTFFPVTQLASAKLELTVRVKTGCEDDTLNLGALAEIRLDEVFPQIATQGCPVDTELRASVELLNTFYTSVEILHALDASPWSLSMEYKDDAIVTFARLTLATEAPSSGPTVVNMVGDKDGFHSGDSADIPWRSQRVLDILDWIGANPDQNAGVDLDLGGVNRPVGFTHRFNLPAGAKITSATIKFLVQGQDSFYNDGIIYDESDTPSLNDAKCQPPAIDLKVCNNRKDFYPYITLRDLLGKKPTNGQPTNFTINLGKVPLRTKDVDHKGGDEWSAYPDEYRNLLGLLADGQFDMIIGDDSQVDYSILEVTFVLPGAPAGDLTGDGKVDRNDLNLLMAAVGTNAYGTDDPRDLTKDGKITVLDVRKISQCPNTGCTP